MLVLLEMNLIAPCYHSHIVFICESQIVKSVNERDVDDDDDDNDDKRGTDVKIDR